MDRLWSGHAFSQVVDYGRSVIAYFTAHGQVPDLVMNRVLAWFPTRVHYRWAAVAVDGSTTR